MKMWNLCKVFIFIVSCGVGEVAGADEYSRLDFPSGFVFGAGTSAYQVEGAAKEDGRTPSIFYPCAHSDGRGPINPKGLLYYNNLINELISHGIEPHVTLHHSDFPQALEDKYGGWISPKMVLDFSAYADVCFREFGDRVWHWTTFNEANIFTQMGYDYGFLPPQRCSMPSGIANCQKGNSSTEPYLVAHNMLLAHASAARLYRKQYRKNKQKGYIGINLIAFYFTPSTNTTEDIVATQRADDFYLGWFADPLMFGDYPDTMKKNVGSRLPSFNSIEK